MTVLAGSSTPSPAPSETVFNVPAPTGSSTPVPLTVNIPIGSGDTFIVNEYDAGSGYLISHFASATPIPVYQNAANTIAITTQSVVSSVQFGSPSAVFLENQASAQTSSPVSVTLYDVVGHTITGPAANPPLLSSTLAGVLASTSVPVPTTTGMTFGYPANSTAQGSVSVTIPTPFPNQSISGNAPLAIAPDWFFLIGDTSGNVNSYDAVTSFTGSGVISSVALPGPAKGFAAARPGCGGFAATALAGVTVGYLATIVNATAAGVLSTVTVPGSVGQSDLSDVTIDPGSCTAYFLNTGHSATAGSLFAVNLSAGTKTPVPVTMPATGYATGISIDPTGTILYTTDTFMGGIAASPIAGPTSGISPYVPGIGKYVLAVGARVFQEMSNGYLNAYEAPAMSTAPVTVIYGSSATQPIASPDGNTIFYSDGGLVYVYDNSQPTLPSSQMNTFSVTYPVSGLAVSSDSATLYVLSGPGGFVNAYAVAATRICASPALLGSFAVPTGSSSIGISP